MADPLEHVHSGRGPATLAALGAAALFLAILLFWFQAAPLIVAVLALFALPALWDVIQNRQASFRLGADRIAWSSGGRSADLALAEIERVRIALRLDFSTKVELFLKDGRKTRLPPECTPKAEALAEALSARGIPLERHKFSF